MARMDIGAATGGFTDCMLKNGADYVYAVDVGSDQLAESLKEDKRVCNMEKTDIRNILPEDIGKKINFISVDVGLIGWIICLLLRRADRFSDFRYVFSFIDGGYTDEGFGS